MSHLECFVKFFIKLSYPGGEYNFVHIFIIIHEYNNIAMLRVSDNDCVSYILLPKRDI